MKKVIFTESQINEVFGSDFTTYLDNSSEGSEVNTDSIPEISNEVFSTEPDLDGIDDCGPIGDKITKSMSNQTFNWGRRVHRPIGLCAEGKKEISERNHKLDNVKLNLGKKVNDLVDSMSGDGDKMINNMSNEKNATANSLYVRQNRLEKMKKEDPLRYQNINGKTIQRVIKNTLKRAADGTKVQNTEIKQLETPDATKGTGKRHEKNNITYEN